MHIMHVENCSRCLTQSMSLAGNCYDNAFLESLWIESLCIESLWIESLWIESLWIESLRIESLRATLKNPRPQPANQNPRLTHLRQRKRPRRPSESERIVRCVYDARVSPVPANSRPEMASI